jgi:hypothetical protein
MTPRSLYWLGQRFRQRQRRQEYFAGLLCSVTANYSMRAPKKPFAPADFMPEQRRSRAKSQDAAAVAENIRALFSDAVEEH